MLNYRRKFLKKILSFSSLILIGKYCFAFPRTLSANWPEKAFRSKTLNEVVQNLFGHGNLSSSKKITLKIPDVAQDGAVVPITITSTLKNVNSIAIFAEKNPIPLIAKFELFPVTEAFVKTRIKLADTGTVTVIASAGNKLYRAQKKVKVAIGGC